MVTLEMSQEGLETFLEEYRFAAVGSLRREGSPFIVPLGYIYDGEYLYLSVKRGRSLPARLRRDPRMCVTIFNNEFPSVAVIIEGQGEFIEDPADEYSRKILERYMGVYDYIDLDEFAKNWLPDRQVVRIRPENVISWDSNKKEDFHADAGKSVAEHRDDKSA